MWATQPARERVEEWLDRALELAAPQSRAHAQALAARSLWRPIESLRTAREASELAERLGDLELRSYALGARSSAALENRRFAEAATFTERRLELLAEITDPDHLVDSYESAVSAISAQARLHESRRLAARHAERSRALSPHHRVHSIAVALDIEELAGAWEAIRDLTPLAETTVAANAATPCVRNARSLLLCALGSLHLGDDKRARELEDAAEAWEMEDFGAWKSEALLRLALVRGELDSVTRIIAGQSRFRAALGPAPFAAQLDALAALHDRAAVEEAAPLVRESPYLQPFALRALGVVREDEALIEQAAARFEALGLHWHAGETLKLKV